MTNHKVTNILLWATIGACAALAQQPTFPSAADACHSLVQAVESNDTQAIAKILGGPTDLASAHDDAADKQDRELFVKKYQQMHRLHHDASGSMILYIGAENWPFPVPLVQKDGAWRFDPDAGSQEVLYRRIGENEMTAIAICHDFVAAKTHHPATSQAGDSAPVTSLAADPAPTQPVHFHGYYFRVQIGRAHV